MQLIVSAIFAYSSKCSFSWWIHLPLFARSFSATRWTCPLVLCDRKLAFFGVPSCLCRQPQSALVLPLQAYLIAKTAVHPYLVIHSARYRRYVGGPVNLGSAAAGAVAIAGAGRVRVLFVTVTGGRVGGL